MVHNGDVTGAMKQMPAAAGTCVPNMSKLIFTFQKSCSWFQCNMNWMRQLSQFAGMETCLILYNQEWSRNFSKILSLSIAYLFFLNLDDSVKMILYFQH